MSFVQAGDGEVGGGLEEEIIFGTMFHRKPDKLGHSTLGRSPGRNSRGYQAVYFI